jgi:hypothetical protein
MESVNYFEKYLSNRPYPTRQARKTTTTLGETELDEKSLNKEKHIPQRKQNKRVRAHDNQT